MDTTAAARQAGVTVATIRTWCARGVVAATKISGRWDINADSLMARISLGRRKGWLSIKRMENRIKARIRAALALPDLTGSPEQTALAAALRGHEIEAALDLLFSDPAKAPLYRVVGHHRGSLADPLHVHRVRDISIGEAKALQADESDYVDLVNRILAEPARCTATHWINNRRRSSR